VPSSIPDEIKSLTINVSDAAALRPVLAIEAARLFASWANVEMMLGTMASILAGDSAAYAILDQIRGKNQQMDAIRAVAVEKIAHTETRDLLKPLFKLINKSAEPRNTLAHRLWGTIPELPDALLLTKAETAIKFGRMMQAAPGETTMAAPTQYSVSVDRKASISNDHAREAIKVLRDGTEVWTQADFDTPRHLLQRAIVALSFYTQAITGSPDDAVAAQARRQLTGFLRETESLY
jgi:hypothetical protein